jgi:SAM-dependent methyltransferase
MGNQPHRKFVSLVRDTYREELLRFYRFVIPRGSRVLEIGCGEGDLLAGLEPSSGLGIDNDVTSIRIAGERHQHIGTISFVCGDVESFIWDTETPFDYIILSDLIPLLQDVQRTLMNLKAVCSPSTRIILNFHNNLWNPVLRVAAFLKIRRNFGVENWFSMTDVKNILYLSGFQVITEGTRVLMPFGIPILTPFFNRFLAKLPGLKHFCLTCTILARPDTAEAGSSDDEPSVSVLIPTRNEKGNIEEIFTRTPQLGRWTELVFVDGNSTDGTIEAIQEAIEKFGASWDRCILLKQNGTGKGQAVRQGFDACRGDILMILDSDLTMPPEDLPKYYDALVSRKGEFINGSRLVYPMENRAMRFLNMIANKMFAVLFTWLLEQPVKDTLCGTKVLWKRDYLTIAENRDYFGDFDPFGDFDLLFGASKLNLKIVDMPVRYRERTYGEIKISRWTHGWLLLRMCCIAMKKLKLS